MDPTIARVLLSSLASRRERLDQQFRHLACPIEIGHGLVALTIVGLLNGDAFREVARFIDIAAERHGEMVGE